MCKPPIFKKKIAELLAENDRLTSAELAERVGCSVQHVQRVAMQLGVRLVRSNYGTRKGELPPYHVRHREELLAKNKAYYAEHREEILVKRKARYRDMINKTYGLRRVLKVIHTENGIRLVSSV